MAQASKLEATGGPLTSLISKVWSFESSEFMPTVIAAVLSLYMPVALLGGRRKDSYLD